MNVGLKHRVPLTGLIGGTLTVEALTDLIASITAGYHTEHTVTDRHKTIHATGTIAERSRTFPLGEPQPGPIATTGFTGSGAQTFAVGTFTTNVFTLVGLELTWYFRFDACAVGGTHDVELRAKLPMQATATVETEIPMLVSDNGGATALGLARILANDMFVRFYVNASRTTNWTLSTASTVVAGQIRIPIRAGI